MKEILRLLDYEVAPLLDASGVEISREELARMFTEWFVLRKFSEAQNPTTVPTASQDAQTTTASPSRFSTRQRLGRMVRPMRRAMRVVGILIMLVPLVFVPAYFFLSTQIPPPTASGTLTLTPAIPLIAPGESQNYSVLTLTTPTRGTTFTSLTAFSPNGLLFGLSQTEVPPEPTTNIPVVIQSSASLALGSYQVTVEEMQGSAIRNQTFTVKVVPALVVMKDVAFVPPDLNVTKGTTVYWMNLDSTIGCCDPGYHDVAFLGAGMNVTSPILKRLDTWSYTFETPGKFYYYCTIHPWMVGLITVSANVTSSSSEAFVSAPESPTVVTVNIPPGGSDPNNGPGFAPDKITVVIGVNNTVTWFNNDTSPHTVTSTIVPLGASAFDSGNMVWLTTFTYTFTVPGTYQYGCSYHPWMTGTVVVKA